MLKSEEIDPSIIFDTKNGHGHVCRCGKALLDTCGSNFSCFHFLHSPRVPFGESTRVKVNFLNFHRPRTFLGASGACRAWYGVCSKVVKVNSALKTRGRPCSMFFY